MRTMTVDQLRAHLAETPVGYFKYVRIGDEFRFADVISMGSPTHLDLQGNDQAIGAGFLKTYLDGMCVEGHSQKLKIGPGDGDEEILSKLLGLPIKNRY